MTAVAGLALAALILAACQRLPDTPDIADDRGTVSVTIVTAGGASHVVLACPPTLPPLAPVPAPPGSRRTAK